MFEIKKKKIKDFRRDYVLYIDDYYYNKTVNIYI